VDEELLAVGRLDEGEAFLVDAADDDAVDPVARPLWR
jgi:hypothetical protein